MITIRYFADAKTAAGTASEPIRLDHGATIADTLTALSKRHARTRRGSCPHPACYSTR